MKRRTILSTLLVGSTASAGCVQIDTQPDQVPIRVQNSTAQQHGVKLECVEKVTGDLLVSTKLELDSGEDESVYAEPIDENGEYVVSIEIEDNVGEASLSGGRLREITVDIRAVDDVRISSVST